MRTCSIVVAGIGVAVLLGCSVVLASDFSSYEGPNAVQVGTGGEKHVVDGVDFWSNGAPPRKFQLLGFITDSRMKSGVIGWFRMHGLESHIADEAKKAGGDAVILVDAEAVTKGYVTTTQANTTATANTTGAFDANTVGNTTMGSYGATTTARAQTNSNAYSTAVQREHSKYAVIKYLADTSTSTSAHPK